MNRRILTLTTDFGADGPYVAAMKGIVLGLAPDARLVDVSHAIAPQNILEGAFVLSSVVESFPEGTIHLAVIDPGVGTERRLVAVRARGQWFVAPDNGLIPGVLQGHAPEVIREIRNPELRRAQVSSTFHGRDILAPAAAHLLLGCDPAELGPARKELVPLGNFGPRFDDFGILGEILFRDRFGNLITNVSGKMLEGPPDSSWIVEVGAERIAGLCRTYAERPPGSVVVLEGSSGWIEIAVVNGDAGRILAAGPGTTVRFRREGH